MKRTAMALAALFLAACGSSTAPLAPSRNEPTLSGPTGTWSITVVLTDYSGTLNFRVQKS